MHNDKEKAGALESIAKENWEAPGGRELAELRAKIAEGGAGSAELEAKSKELAKIQQERLAKMQQERLEAEADAIAKARENAVPTEIRGAASSIIAELEAMDKELRENAGNDKAQMAMEEMWKVRQLC